MNSITLNTQTFIDNHVFPKSFADQFHQENEQSGRDFEKSF